MDLPNQGVPERMSGNMFQAAERREQEMVITLREERATEQRCLDSGIVAPSTLNESQRSYLRGVENGAAIAPSNLAASLAIGISTWVLATVLLLVVLVRLRRAETLGLAASAALRKKPRWNAAALVVH